jgi:hypothetical protein
MPAINPEQEIEAIRKITEILSPFQPPARHRILGYIKHFMKAPSGKPSDSEAA